MKLYFAPLQGYTEDVYRRLHHQFFGGVTEYYTPFLRVENHEVRSKDLRDIHPEHNAGVPVVPQIIAADEAEFDLLLSVITERGYRQVDVNMGCPFPLQTRHGRGSGILPHPHRVRALCQCIQQYPDVQFSIKMRLGLQSPDEWRALLPILADTPLRHITLHPRVGVQQYKGEVDMQQFADFLGQCPHPVIYNGDVTTVQQIHDLERLYPTLSGIMLGRGLLARPSLAMEYEQGASLPDSQLLALLRDLHAHLLMEYERIIPSESQRLSKVHTLSSISGVTFRYLSPLIPIPPPQRGSFSCCQPW